MKAVITNELLRMLITKSTSNNFEKLINYLFINAIQVQFCGM